MNDSILACDTAMVAKDACRSESLVATKLPVSLRIRVALWDLGRLLPIYVCVSPNAEKWGIDLLISCKRNLSAHRQNVPEIQNYIVGSRCVNRCCATYLHRYHPRVRIIVDMCSLSSRQYRQEYGGWLWG